MNQVLRPHLVQRIFAGKSKETEMEESVMLQIPLTPFVGSFEHLHYENVAYMFGKVSRDLLINYWARRASAPAEYSTQARG